MANEVKRRAAIGAIWTTLQNFAEMGIRFLSGIILARILMPEDYGIIGMLSIFMQVSLTFLDGGFGAALIQKKKPTQTDYSTIFWWNLLMAALLYLTLFSIAPYVASFYRMPILCKVLRVQAVILIISALTMVQTNQLRKTFQFKKMAMVSLVSSCISLGTTILLAYLGYGVWALVVQNILMTLIPSVVYWIMNRWLPDFVFSKQSFKELFSFGVYMLLTHVIGSICENIQGLLIGRIYNATTMGYYSKARHTENLASTSISSSLIKVTFPLYSEFQNDKEALSHLIKQITQMVAYITFPLMFLLILIAKPVFVLLYSERWMSSIPYFQVLCLSGVAVCLQAVNLQAITAIGKSKTMFTWTLLKRGVGLCLIVGGLWLGEIYGMLIGMVIQSWFVYIINTYLVSKHIGYKMSSQLMDILPILFLSMVSLSVSWSVAHLFELNIYADGILKTVIFLGIYISYSILRHFESYNSCKQLLPVLLKKIKK